MRREVIAVIPGKFTSFWLADARAALDEWTNFFVTLPDFKQAVFDTALAAAARKGARAWIVDSTKAKGALPEEVQTFIGKQGHALMAKNKIEHFITLRPTSATTTMSLQRVERVVGPSGMKLITVESVDAALEYLRSVDQKAA